MGMVMFSSILEGLDFEDSNVLFFKGGRGLGVWVFGFLNEVGIFGVS